MSSKWLLLLVALCCVCSGVVQGAGSVYTYKFEDKYTPDSCEKIAKAGDHILVTYETWFVNGSAGPSHPQYTQPLHTILDPRDELPLHQAIKGMCQNSTRALKWDSTSMLHGVALHPIIGVGLGVLELNEPLVMDLHVDHITDPSDYQIFDAFKHNNVSRLLDLIDEHVGINAMDEYGQTPLMMAVSRQYLPVVASLLNTRRPKVDVNMAKASGFTAVYYAVEKATPTILQALLRRGADPNVAILQEGSRGNTPLHYACMLEKTKAAELLLEFGANPLSRNEHGQTPLQMVPPDALRTSRLQLKSIFEAAYNKIQQQAEATVGGGHGAAGAVEGAATSTRRPGAGGSPRQDM